MWRCESCTAAVVELHSEQPDAPGCPPKTQIRLTTVTVPPPTPVFHKIDSEYAMKLLCDRNAAIRVRLPSCRNVTLDPNEPHLE